jgi:hypothetical protein
LQLVKIIPPVKAKLAKGDIKLFFHIRLHFLNAIRATVKDLFTAKDCEFQSFRKPSVRINFLACKICGINHRRLNIEDRRKNQTTLA